MSHHSCCSTTRSSWQNLIPAGEVFRCARAPHFRKFLKRNWVRVSLRLPLLRQKQISVVSHWQVPLNEYVGFGRCGHELHGRGSGLPVRSCEHRDSRLPVRTPDIANDLPRLDHTRGKAQTEVNCWALRISQSWGDLLHMIHRWALRQPLLRRPVFSHPTDSTPSRCVQCRRWDERHALIGVQFVPKWISNLLGSCRYAVQRWSPSARLPASCAACVVRIKGVTGVQRLSKDPSHETEEEAACTTTM
jgi:hypothetical protein